MHEESSFYLHGGARRIRRSVAAAVANAEPPRRHSKSVLEQNEEERYVLLTGSNIPQKVKVKSIGTDSVHNIRIYTQRELLSTGRQTVAGSLALDPSIQISGR